MAGVRQTSCRHCGQDIEALAPYRRGTWRDRGNNPTCPTRAGDAGQVHQPLLATMGPAPLMWTRQRAGVFTGGRYVISLVPEPTQPPRWVLTYNGIELGDYDRLYAAQQAGRVDYADRGGR